MSPSTLAHTPPNVNETRVTVFPPTRTDGLAMGRVLDANRIACTIIASMATLCTAIRVGAGIVIISEEALIADPSELIACLTEQPVWSDLPILVLAHSGVESLALSRIVHALGNVSVIERPVRASTLVSFVRSALRARNRQYQVRDYLVAQERSQLAIREGEQRYRSLIANVSDYAIFMTDTGGRICSWNSGAQAVLGYTDQEVLGRSISSLVFGESGRDLIPRQIHEAGQPARTKTEGWIVRKDGARLYVETVLAAIHDEGGQLRGYGSFLRDVTAKHEVELEREHLLDSERAARGEAERASRTKDEFLAVLSHELRTPLNAVLGWAQVARQVPNLTREVDGALTIIERNARAQAQIIADLLDMSSILAGKLRLVLQRIDLATVIHATLETIKPSVQAKDIRLHIVLDPLAGPVRGDPTRLQQVVWNLFTNAVKFTPKGGRISIVLARVNSQLEVEIADSGEGIDPAFLPHVFDRFRQADSSTRRRHGGLGLGLSIVKQLLELHGGDISAKSAGVGLGSSFRITLPLMAASSAPMEADSDEVQAGSPMRPEPIRPIRLRGFKVLVVDDEPDARLLIQRLLSDCEASVITAASADEAIALIVEERPDLLISDIGMSQADGYTLIRRLRERKDDLANIPAIALTAYARMEDRIKAIQVGYQVHLTKPVEPLELVTLAESLLSRTSGSRSR